MNRITRPRRLTPKEAAKYKRVRELIAEEFAADPWREVGPKIALLRQNAGLSQAQLAQQINTTQSVISRIENSTYKSHSLSMLRRLATALGQHVEVRFVPLP